MIPMVPMFRSHWLKDFVRNGGQGWKGDWANVYQFLGDFRSVIIGKDREIASVLDGIS